MKIPRRKLGRQGLEVSAIGLGCMGMSQVQSPTDDANHLRALNAALDMGINFLDTADIYGGGANERLLGQVLETRRAEVVVATKFGQLHGSHGEFLGIDGTPQYVRTACDASLKRLRVDHIDLYYQHRLDPKVAIEETVGAMADLVREGKVRHLGLSQVSAATLRRATSVHPIAALQGEYSLWTRELEATLLPTCEELGVGLVARSPLGRGFLAGGAFNTQHGNATGSAVIDSQSGDTRFSGSKLASKRHVAAIVAQIASDQGYTPAQVSLAWLLDCAPYIVPIPGTRSIRRLKENALSVMVRLDEAKLERLYGILRERRVPGERVAGACMAGIGA